MKIIYKGDRTDFLKEKGTALALGNFDGVHTGHKRLLCATSEIARENGLVSCVYTFLKHPRTYTEDNTTSLITNNSEKEKIISSLGLDAIYYENFLDVKDYDAQKFCSRILKDTLNCKIVICGENFRFAKDRSAGSGVLKTEAEKLGMNCIVIPYMDDDNEKLNSTRIRKLIRAGDIQKANELLGHTFSIYYPVIHGRHLGTQIGVPTINQTFEEEKLKPKNGVYACICHIDGKEYMSVSNVGVKPTVTYNEKNPPVLCETHIIGYSGNLYGKSIKVDFYKKLRDEKRFSSLDELVSEVKKNIEETELYFSREKKIEKE